MKLTPALGISNWLGKAFVVLLGLGIIAGLFGNFMFALVEAEPAETWSFEWVLIPSFLLVFVWLVVDRLKDKAKRLKDKPGFWQLLKTYSGMLLASIVFAVVFSGGAAEMVLVWNAIGTVEEVPVNGRVVSFDNGRLWNTVEIEDSASHQILKLNAEGTYEVGGNFSKIMKKGSLGLLFQKD